jgi:hypothetical protein
MKLMDVFPRDPDAIHQILHSHKSTQAENEARIKDLHPFGEAITKCLEQCGSVTNDACVEFMVIMSTVCIIDQMLEQVTKENA